MLTTLEMARAEFGFYAAHIALYNGEVELCTDIPSRRPCVFPASPIPLVNTTLEALAGYLLSQVLPQLQRAGLVDAELEISELPGTSATARVDLG